MLVPFLFLGWLVLGPPLLLVGGQEGLPLVVPGDSSVLGFVVAADRLLMWLLMGLEREVVHRRNLLARTRGES